MAVLGYNPVSERVITLRVNAKPVNITFVQVCAQTGASSEVEITAFYEQLQGVLENVCRKDVIVIMEDWNAKIGKFVHNTPVTRTHTGGAVPLRCLYGSNRSGIAMIAVVTQCSVIDSPNTADNCQNRGPSIPVTPEARCHCGVCTA